MIKQKKWYDVERYKVNIGAIGFFVIMQTSMLFTMFLSVYLMDTGRMSTATSMITVVLPVFVIFVWFWIAYVIGDMLIHMAQWFWQRRKNKQKISIFTRGRKK